MSYILDALKKAEEERRGGKNPQRPPSMAQGTRVPKRRFLWLYVLLAATLLNGALFFLWLKPWQPENIVRPLDAGVKQKASNVSVGRDLPSDSGARRESPTQPAADTETEGTPQVPSPAGQAPGDQLSSAPHRTFKTPGIAPDMSHTRELPASLQKELQDIVISGHYYDNEPSARLVTVSGRIVREGQMLPSGLKVEQITPSGVVFSFQGRRIQKGVF